MVSNTVHGHTRDVHVDHMPFPRRSVLFVGRNAVFFHYMPKFDTDLRQKTCRLEFEDHVQNAVLSCSLVM